MANVEFVEADAQTHRFAPQSFDAMVSRFGVMFFADPVAAFRNLRGAARPGAKLACAAWRNAMLPTTSVFVCTERIRPTAARLSSTTAMSATKTTMPRSRAGGARSGRRGASGRITTRSRSGW